MNGPPDPLGYDAPLPLSEAFYPMGYPLRVETNCAAVLALSASLWSKWPPRQVSRSALFRVFVSGSASTLPLHPGMPCGQKHLVSITHSPENLAMCDVRQSFAYARVTRDVAEDIEYFQYHFLEPLAWLMIDAAYTAPVHASSIAWGDKAILLCGDSGAGKTSLAYACARQGWTYLSDDATHIIRGRPAAWVAGRPFRIRFRESARRLFPELNRFAPKRRPNGKLDIEVETEALGLRVATEKPAAQVIFLDRRSHDVRAGLYEYPVADAVARLQPAVVHGDEEIRRDQQATFDQLLGLPCMRLAYDTPDSAERILRDLIGGTAA